MKQIRVGIVGATGYTGAELVRLFQSHQGVEIVAVTSARAAGEPLDQHCPWLHTGLTLTSFDPETIDADVVFLAQEHGFAMRHAPTLIRRGIKVIDLSADYRLNDPAEFGKYYGMEFVKGGDFRTAYGLCEMTDHATIRSADLIANPGCYPTASLLAMRPLYQAGLATSTPVVDAKSGVSGAGRAKNSSDYIFNERSGSFAAYGMVGHRHTAELEQALGVPVRFTPHLIPVPRGMEVTCHIPAARPTSTEEIKQILREKYKDSPFVRVVDAIPETKAIIGSNRCDIGAVYDERTQYIVTTSVIDNLVKGASGQAIQNMNIMFGFAETEGLPVSAVWP
jgi:N-acetyl-gamma-glutamyl-phosphate reductase